MRSFFSLSGGDSCRTDEWTADRESCLATAEVESIFADEAAAGEIVSDTYDDGSGLLASEIVPTAGDVRSPDQMQRGAARFIAPTDRRTRKRTATAIGSMPRVEQGAQYGLPAVLGDINLPELASDLIRLALDDFRECDEDPRYRINMSVLHEQDCTGRTGVCLAGAVIARTFGAPIHKSVSVVPKHYGCLKVRNLMALPMFAGERILDALVSLGVPKEEAAQIQAEWRALGIRIPRIPTGSRPSDEFYLAMNELADFLESKGL